MVTLTTVMLVVTLARMESKQQNKRGRYVPTTGITLKGTIDDISKKTLPKISNQAREAAKNGHEKRANTLNQKVEDLSRKLDDLSALRSGEDQIALYGPEEWNRRFVRQGELWREIGFDRVRDLYDGDNGLRNSRIHRIQSWLSSPMNYAIPGQLERMPQGAHFQLAARGLISRAHCFGCLVDPDRLSPRMLQEVGIIDWDDFRKERGLARLSAEDVIKAKSDPAVILQLKYIIDSARPLDGKLRLLVVRQPTVEVDEFYRTRVSSTRPELLSALHVPQEALGKTFYFREEDSGTRTLVRLSKEFVVVPLVASLHKSLYGAHRAALHTNDGYEKERLLLSSFFADVRSLVGAIEKTWTRDATAEVKEELKARLRQLTSEGSSQFRKAENIFKQEILASLEHIGVCMDQGMSVIPAAKINQLKKILRQVNHRMYEVKKKAEKRFSDHLSIEDTVRECTCYFDAFEKVLADHLDDLNKGKTLKVSLVRGALEPFKEMDIRPFSTFAEKLISAVDEFEVVAQGSDKASIRGVLLKLHLICRLQKFQAGTELLLNKISRSEPLALDDVSQAARSLQDVLPERSKFGRNSYTRLCSEYPTFRARARDICSKLEEAKRVGAAGTSLEGLSEDLRALLKLSDLEDAVRKIP